MLSCTFFGHRDTPKKIEPILQSTLIDLIENKNIRSFYVGNQGDFDSMVRKNLKYLKSKYFNIDYTVVLAYMPDKKEVLKYADYSDSIYPEEVANTFPRYAIDKRNRWMINKSDYAITYVKNSIGGAAKFKELAEKKGLIIINLAE